MIYLVHVSGTVTVEAQTPEDAIQAVEDRMPADVKCDVDVGPAEACGVETGEERKC